MESRDPPARCVRNYFSFLTGTIVFGAGKLTFGPTPPGAAIGGAKGTPAGGMLLGCGNGSSFGTRPPGGGNIGTPLPGINVPGYTPGCPETGTPETG